MKAAVVMQAGQMPVYSDVDEPAPADGHAIIDVEASALSHITRGRASGTHYSSSARLPFVAGIDGVGRRREDGKRVYFFAPKEPSGGLAERTAGDDARAAGDGEPADVLREPVVVDRAIVVEGSGDGREHAGPLRLLHRHFSEVYRGAGPANATWSVVGLPPIAIAELRLESRRERSRTEGWTRMRRIGRIPGQRQKPKCKSR